MHELQAKRDSEDAAHYRSLKSPEAIDRLALSLAFMGVHVPPRDTAFFQAIVSQWLEVKSV
jgi:hypothetical protein